MLLLNIIFGIIIDTFGKLREDASERKHMMTNYCFVCGLSKDVFEAVSYSEKDVARIAAKSSVPVYTEHIKNEHNMWDYVFFVIYLKMKDENNYTGIER